MRGIPLEDTCMCWGIACSQMPCQLAHHHSYADLHTGRVQKCFGCLHASSHHLPIGMAATQLLYTPRRGMS